MNKHSFSMDIDQIDNMELASLIDHIETSISDGCMQTGTY